MKYDHHSNISQTKDLFLHTVNLTISILIIIIHFRAKRNNWTLIINSILTINAVRRTQNKINLLSRQLPLLSFSHRGQQQASLTIRVLGSFHSKAFTFFFLSSLQKGLRFPSGIYSSTQPWQKISSLIFLNFFFRRLVMVLWSLLCMAASLGIKRFFLF